MKKALVGHLCRLPGGSRGLQGTQTTWPRVWPGVAGIIKDSELRAAYSAAARKRAVVKFSQTLQTLRYVGLYEELAAS